ncbi:hypothetical protein EON64_01340 [archaeon]|nr:MAG: hypothetical protein EON64_01340 [archaeon]
MFCGEHTLGTCGGRVGHIFNSGFITFLEFMFIRAMTTIAGRLPVLFEDSCMVVVNKPSGMLSVPGREGRVTYDTLSRTDQWLGSIKALTEQSDNHPYSSVISMLRGRGHEVPRSEAKFARYLQRVTKVREAYVHNAIWEQLCATDRKLNGVDLGVLPESLTSAADLVEQYCDKRVLHVHRLDQETSGLLVFAKSDAHAGM